MNDRNEGQADNQKVELVVLMTLHTLFYCTKYRTGQSELCSCHTGSTTIEHLLQPRLLHDNLWHQFWLVVKKHLSSLINCLFVC